MTLQRTINKLHSRNLIHTIEQSEFQNPQKGTFATTLISLTTRLCLRISRELLKLWMVTRIPSLSQDKLTLWLNPTKTVGLTVKVLSSTTFSLASLSSPIQLLVSKQQSLQTTYLCQQKRISSILSILKSSSCRITSFQYLQS